MAGGTYLFFDGALEYYFKWYVASTIFFGITFGFFKILLDLLKLERYAKKDKNDKLLFAGLWTANTHHFVVNILVLMTIYYPKCNPNTFLAQVREEDCFYYSDSLAVRNLMFTCGYLTYDLILLFTVYDQKDKLTTQMKWHHVVGSSGLVAAIYAGYCFPNLGNIALTCEVSTMFLNYRSMYTKEELGKPVPMVNQLVFFFTFTIFRIISFPIIIVYELYGIYMVFNQVNALRKFAIFVQFANLVWMLCLNFMWYGLILKGLKKLLQGAGLLAPDAKTGDKKKEVRDKLVDSDEKAPENGPE